MSAAGASPWIWVPAPVARPRLRLFCFHHAGGNAAVFRWWPDKLPPDVELCTFPLPGRGMRYRDPLVTSMDVVLREVEAALSPWMGVPYVLFGHSMGALLAYELTRLLRRRRQPLPVRLVVSGHRAPHLPRRAPAVHEAPGPELIRELQRWQGTPRELLESPELLELMLPVLRSDFALAERYAHREEPALDIPLSVYGGSEDPMISEEELAGWSRHTSVDFRSTVLPGGHFYLYEKPEPWLAALGAELSAARTAAAF